MAKIIRTTIKAPRRAGRKFKLSVRDVSNESREFEAHKRREAAAIARSEAADDPQRRRHTLLEMSAQALLS
jgi:hypothetical protein